MVWVRWLKLNTSSVINLYNQYFFFTLALQSLGVQDLPTVEDSWSHSVRHITLSRTPLDEWSGHRDLYLTTHNTHKRQASMPPAGLEPTIPASQQLQTHTLDCIANITNITCTKLYISDVGSCDVPQESRILSNVWCVYFGAYNVGYVN